MTNFCRSKIESIQFNAHFDFGPTLVYFPRPILKPLGPEVFVTSARSNCLVATGEESAMAGGGGASPSCAAVAGWTVTAVLLQVVGLSMFLYGFFPVKPTLPGFRFAPLPLLCSISGCRWRLLRLTLGWWPQWSGELPDAVVWSRRWRGATGASAGSAQISVQGETSRFLRLRFISCCCALLVIERWKI